MRTCNVLWGNHCPFSMSTSKKPSNWRHWCKNMMFHAGPHICRWCGQIKKH